MSNNGPDSGCGQLNDPLPNGAPASATWSCVVTSGTATSCPASSGTGPISQQLTLASGESFTYTVRWSSPASGIPPAHDVAFIPTADSAQDPYLGNNTMHATPPCRQTRRGRWRRRKRRAVT